MKLRNPLLLRCAGFCVAVVARVWLATIRVLQAAADGTTHPTDPTSRPCIYAVWHDSILPLLNVRTRIDILISRHADGEVIAQACRHLNYGVVRGSSTRGGAVALRQLTRGAGDRHLLVTPDGPRGPRHQVRPGLVYLASITGLPIILIAFGYSRAWRLKTWDRLSIPLPWSKVCRVQSEPIRIAPQLCDAELTDYCGRIEQRFIQLTASAQRWAETGRRPSCTELQPTADGATFAKCA